jgi:branched-chain amino acid transport system ATP-binding protein
VTGKALSRADALAVTGLSAGYDGGTVLHGISLTVEPGTVHALLGPNGAGKSTLIHAVSGLLRPDEGSIRIGPREVAGRPAHRTSRAGVGLVPQGRRVFASLTVAEHLRLARRTGEWTSERVLGLLPRLGERLGNRGDELSGGEQQMLALARALLGQPTVLLLDEPTEGLAPTVTEVVHELVRSLARDGLSILLTAPRIPLATAVADRVSVLVGGRITGSWAGDAIQECADAIEHGLSLAVRPPI